MKSCVKWFLAPSGVFLLVALSNSAKGDILYESSSGSIDTVSSSGSVSLFDNDPNGPQGLVFSSSGILYVSNFGTNTIQEYSQSGANLGIFASGASLSGRWLVPCTLSNPSATKMRNPNFCVSG